MTKSSPARPYSAILLEAISRASAGCSLRELRTLLAFARYADENGTAWPSIDQLAQDTGLPARRVSDAIKSLSIASPDRPALLQTLKAGGGHARSARRRINLEVALSIAPPHRQHEDQPNESAQSSDNYSARIGTLTLPDSDRDDSEKNPARIGQSTLPDSDNYSARIGTLTLPDSDRGTRNGTGQEQTKEQTSELSIDDLKRQRGDTSPPAKPGPTPPPPLTDQPMGSPIMPRPKPAPVNPTSELPGFDAFWETWPRHHRKTEREKCRAKWVSDGLERSAAAVVGHVKACKRSKDWQRDDGQFVPAPIRYLNQKKFEAPAPPAAEQSGDFGGLTEAELLDTTIASPGLDRRRQPEADRP